MDFEIKLLLSFLLCVELHAARPEWSSFCEEPFGKAQDATSKKAGTEGGKAAQIIGSIYVIISDLLSKRS